VSKSAMTSTASTMPIDAEAAAASNVASHDQLRDLKTACNTSIAATYDWITRVQREMTTLISCEKTHQRLTDLLLTSAGIEVYANAGRPVVFPCFKIPIQDRRLHILSAPTRSGGSRPPSPLPSSGSAGGSQAKMSHAGVLEILAALTAQLSMGNSLDSKYLQWTTDITGEDLLPPSKSALLATLIAQLSMGNSVQGANRTLVAPAWLFHPLSPDKKFRVFDTCAEGCFLTERLATILGLTGTDQLQILKLLSTTVAVQSRLVQFGMQSCTGEHRAFGPDISVIGKQKHEHAQSDAATNEDAIQRPPLIHTLNESSVDKLVPLDRVDEDSEVTDEVDIERPQHGPTLDETDAIADKDNKVAIQHPVGSASDKSMTSTRVSSTPNHGE
jgi:hypothetical protein